MNVWKNIRSIFHPVPEIPVWQFYLRLLLIVLMVTAAYLLSEEADPFFYQGF